MTKKTYRWQTFRRKRRQGGRPVDPEPMAFLDTDHGTLRLNRAARELIGGAGHAMLVFDDEAGVIGVKATDADNDLAYTVSPRNGAVSIRALLDHLKVRPPAGPRAVALDDDTLFITLEPA